MAVEDAKYDVVAFEKVTVQEAREYLGANVPSTKNEGNWEPKRRPVHESDLKLTEETIKWLSDLPEHVRPLRLARQFPRITNRFAAEWQRPMNCDKYFDELMIDHRGTRRGFSFEIAKEIADLRAYFSTEVFKFDKYYSEMWVIAP